TGVSSPTFASNAAFSNSGTIWPCPNEPRSPHCAPEPVSSDSFFASSSNFAPAWICLRMSSAFAFGQLLLAGLCGGAALEGDENVTGFDFLVVVLVLLVVALQLFVARLHRRVHLLQLSLRDEVLAHEVELRDDFRILVEARLRAFGCEELHPDVVFRELALAGPHRELLVL